MEKCTQTSPGALFESFAFILTFQIHFIYAGPHIGTGPVPELYTASLETGMFTS